MLDGAGCGLVAAWRPSVPGPVENIRAVLDVAVEDVVVPETCREIVAKAAGAGTAGTGPFDAP